MDRPAGIIIELWTTSRVRTETENQLPETRRGEANKYMYPDRRACVCCFNGRNTTLKPAQVEGEQVWELSVTVD